VNVPVKNRRFKKIKLEGLSPGGLYNTIQYITIQYNTCQYNTLHYIHYIAIHETTIHDITLQYISLHCNTLQNITLNYIAVNDVTLHYIQKDKHTLHTLHKKKKHTYIIHYIHYIHYITFYSIALHYISYGRTDIRTYICHEKYQKRKSLPKKNSQSPCEHHENIGTKSPFFIQGLTHQISPALLMAARPLGMSANFTPSEGEQNPGDPQVTWFCKG
jgi:hypothetical protein